ncbi:MAG: hypothetical protein ACLUZX_01290 [Subdoligranulum sp.]
MGYNTPKQTVSQFQLKGRYARQYLSFAGKSSKDFLLYLSGPGVYDSPAADVESTSVPGRNGDIITENAHWNMKRSYRLAGKSFLEQNLVSFPISDTFPLVFPSFREKILYVKQFLHRITRKKGLPENQTQGII